jgi:branched-chain amino acid transport system permease protein
VTHALQSLIDSLSFGSVYALVALGIALVFGVMRMINFAHGEIIMIGAYGLFYMSSLAVSVTIVLVLAAAIALALVLERVAFRPVRGANPATMLVTSFAVSYVLQNLMSIIAGARAKGVDLSPKLLQDVDIGRLRIPMLDLITIGTSVVVIVLLWLFLSHTLIGIQMRAAADDFLMTRLLGVRANTVIAAGFAASGLLAGLVAILLVAQLGSITPTMGLTPVLVGFVAAMIGGIGNLVGALVGGYLLGLVTVLFQAYLPANAVSFRDALVYGFVILLLLVRPQGLFASSAEATRV